MASDGFCDGDPRLILPNDEHSGSRETMTLARRLKLADRHCVERGRAFHAALL
jgi:hypothetical protein